MMILLTAVTLGLIAMVCWLAFQRGFVRGANERIEQDW